jgi:hypothetical protein
VTTPTIIINEMCRAIVIIGDIGLMPLQECCRKSRVADEIAD